MWNSKTRQYSSKAFHREAKRINMGDEVEREELPKKPQDREAECQHKTLRKGLFPLKSKSKYRRPSQLPYHNSTPIETITHS